MSDFKNKKSGIFQGWTPKLFLFLSGTNMVQFTSIERGTYLVSVNGNGKNVLKPVKLVVQ